MTAGSAAAAPRGASSGGERTPAASTATPTAPEAKADANATAKAETRSTAKAESESKAKSKAMSGAKSKAKRDDDDEPAGQTPEAPPPPAEDPAPTGDAPGSEDDPGEGGGSTTEGAATSDPAPLDAEAAALAAKLGEGKISLMVPDFTAVSEGVSEGDLETVVGITVYQLSKVKRLDVVSGADIRELLQLEADKEAAGCSESSCLSEVADALGAQLIVAGQVGRLGARYVISLALIYVAEARAVARSQVTLKKLGEAPEELMRAVHELTRAFGGVPGAEDELEEEQRTFTRWAIEAANDPDMVMLVTLMITGLGALAGPVGWALTPLAQSLVLWWFGDDLAGRTYPTWWAAMVAGYVTYMLAFVIGSVAIGGGAAAGGAYGAGGVAVGTAAVATLVIFGLEPLMAWFAGTYGASDVDLFTEDVTTPEDPKVTSLELFGTQGPWRGTSHLWGTSYAAALGGTP